MGHLDVVVRVLDNDDWNYEVVAEDHLLRMGFSGDHGSWRVYVQADDDDVVSVNSVLNQFVPDQRRSEVVELLTRINWGMRVGGFQFDYSDGEIRFHSAIDVEGGELTEYMFRSLLHTNLATTDRYFGPLMAVCYANVDSVSALLAVESGG